MKLARGWEIQRCTTWTACRGVFDLSLFQDVLAMGTGIVAACLGSSGTGPMLVTFTAFDILGSATSMPAAVRTKLRAEWMPVAIHGFMGVWGLRLCWNQYAY